MTVASSGFTWNSTLHARAHPVELVALDPGPVRQLPPARPVHTAPVGPRLRPASCTEPESGWLAYTTFAPLGLSQVMVTVLLVVPGAEISYRSFGTSLSQTG